MKVLSFLLLSLGSVSAASYASFLENPIIGSKQLPTMRSGQGGASHFANLNMDLVNAVGGREVEALDRVIERLDDGEKPEINSLQDNALKTIIKLRNQKDIPSIITCKLAEYQNDKMARHLSQQVIKQGNLRKEQGILDELKSDSEAKRQAALERYGHRVQSNVPLAIQAIIPADVLGACDFKDGDNDLDKAKKLARLGLYVFDAPDIYLQVLKISRAEVHFLAAKFFKDAGDFMVGAFDNLAGNEAEKKDYAVSTYQLYTWSYAQLEKANRLESVDALNVLWKRNFVEKEIRENLIPGFTGESLRKFGARSQDGA